MEIDRRLELQEKLERLLGSENVYFQPPENFKMGYPCIVYSHDNNNVFHADNVVYKRKRRYKITYICHDPDDDLVNTLADIPMCSMDRRYTADNLIHYVYTLYF